MDVATDLDRLIERRADKTPDPDELEPSYAESIRRDRGNAAVAGQLFGTFIRSVSAEIKVKEVLELEERIEQLERIQEGGKRWGA